ncbi:hypothetical protein NDU88_009852 [Pleurodeles waltl]|uniref:Uncharacterized protein n=1 Tax=Pleurodeles waltl TaxID=8319 RepID=A0AAV7RXF3_PLEWA|nr:hypothetical protein NDU88_009852 [Pleurodeles waltl]
MVTWYSSYGISKILGDVRSGGVELRLHGGWMPRDPSSRELMLKTYAGRRRKSQLAGYRRLEIQVRSRDEAKQEHNETLGLNSLVEGVSHHLLFSL